jgi:hypothetical protein
MLLGLIFFLTIVFHGWKAFVCTQKQAIGPKRKKARRRERDDQKRDRITLCSYLTQSERAELSMCKL